MSNSPDEKLKAYEQLCTSYRAIDDFRAKLLAFLPLATGGGIFLLANLVKEETRQFLLPVGIFGFVITLGLFSYEIYGIKKCHALIETGIQLENSLGAAGQFKSRPRGVFRLINEPFAAGVIYPAVLAAWVFLALVFAWPQVALLTAILVFIVGFVGSIIYDFLLRRAGTSNDANKQGEQARHEVL